MERISEGRQPYLRAITSRVTRRLWLFLKPGDFPGGPPIRLIELQDLPEDLVLHVVGQLVDRYLVLRAVTDLLVHDLRGDDPGGYHRNREHIPEVHLLGRDFSRSEEHTSELQSRLHLV